MTDDATTPRSLVFQGSLDEFDACLQHTLTYQGGIMLDYDGFRSPDACSWRLEIGNTVLVVSQDSRSTTHTSSWSVFPEDEVYRYINATDSSGMPDPAAVMELVHSASVHARQTGDCCVVEFIDGRVSVYPHDAFGFEPLGDLFGSFVELIIAGIGLWKSASPYVGLDTVKEQKSEKLSVEAPVGVEGAPGDYPSWFPPKREETLAKWRRSYDVIREKLSEYRTDYDDLRADDPNPTIDDLRDALAMTDIWNRKPSRSTVERIRKAGAKGWLD